MLLGLLGELFLVVSLGGPLYYVLRPTVGIWRGDATRVPHLPQISVNARSYLVFLFWFVPVFGGLLLIATTALVVDLTGVTEVAVMSAYAGIAMMFVGTPMILLHWFVSALARPKLLIPPPYRTQRGSIAEKRERRRRQRAGMPPTDHRVEILDMRSRNVEDDPYLYASCREPECGWHEYADAKLVGPPEEEQLRAKAATHTTNVAPGLQRIDPPEPQ